MCVKPETMVRDEDEGQATDGANAKENGSVASGGSKRKNETSEEKLKRRKLERKQRNLAKRQAKGLLPATQSIPKKIVARFSEVWDRENAFVLGLMECLPEVRQPGLALREEEMADEYITQGKRQGADEGSEKELTEKFNAKVRKNLKQQGVETTTERAKTYQELKERLHSKIAELAQKPNEKKREKKLKKKQAKLKEKESNKGKKLISQSTFPKGPHGSETEVKQEGTEEKKTPLKKKPVVKSNGEIVYSKFDFISNDSMQNGTPDVKTDGRGKKGNAKPTTEQLLQKVQKHEKAVANLAKHGKKSEAVDLASTQKWDTALKRAEGHKVRDDAYLLKKSMKKMEKQKQLTKKKWKDRVERVEKQKEQRQQKRQTNIQSRKDDKKKRTKKLLRKRGRIE